MEHLLLTALGDLLLPRTCLVCGDVLRMRERYLCLRCAADLPFTGYEAWPHNPMSDRFNALLAQAQDGGRCPDGQVQPYVHAAALFYYRAGYRAIPQAVKFNGDVGAGQWFGRLLGGRLARSPQFADVDTLVPVPLHWWRRYRRGYNQAEVLCRGVGQGWSAALLGPQGAADGRFAPRCQAALLQRHRYGGSQVQLNAGERMQNMAQAFRFHPPRPPSAGHLPRHVLLLDDTFTTGATLCACYNALRQALDPQVRISVATLAVVE